MNGTWVREPHHDAGVVIFVHGILSSGETCWKHTNGAYWPALLSQDSTLSDLGIYVYTYQTSITSGYYSVSDIASDLKERLKGTPAGQGTIWQGKGPLFFVCHSMGGIVARNLIVRNQAELIELGAKIGLFLVASPSLGSSYANWVTTIARAAGHTQAIALKFGQDNQWLNELDSDFQTLKESGRLPMVGRELQEDKFIVRRVFGLFPQIVEPFSAHRYFGDPLKVSNSDHFSISKPADRTAIAHMALIRFLKEDGARLTTLTARGRVVPEIKPHSAFESSVPTPAPLTVGESADDWPWGGASFVCVTERGPSGAETVKSFQEYCAIYGSPLPPEQSFSGLAVRGFFENGGAFAVVSRAIGQGANRARASIPSSSSGQVLVVSARDAGAFGNRMQVEIASATRKGLRLIIRETRIGEDHARVCVLEDFDNVPIDGNQAVNSLCDYINQRSSWIGASIAQESFIHGDHTPSLSGTWDLRDGSDGVLTVASLLGTFEGLPEVSHRSGLAALVDSASGLVCIPDLAQPWLEAEQQQRVISALLAHCMNEQAMAVLATGTPDGELTRVLAPCDSEYAIAAWPWLIIACSDSRQATVPPDGHVAGVVARSERHGHSAAVRCTLNGALATAPRTSGSGDQLSELALDADRRGINLLMSVDDKIETFLRPMITTALAEGHRSPTRLRLLMSIRRWVRFGLAWAMYTPKSEDLELQIVRHTEQCLHKLWKAGSLSGESPERAYKVTIEENASMPGYLLTIDLTCAPDNYRLNVVCALPSSDCL